MKRGVVYGLLCPLTYIIMYVGQTTKSPSIRFSGHKTVGKIGATLGKTSPIHPWLCCLFDMNLIEQLDYIIIEDNVPANKLRDREEFWINRISKTNPLLLNGDIHANIPLKECNKNDITFLKSQLSYDQISRVTGIKKRTFALIVQTERGSQVNLNKIHEVAVKLKQAA